MKPRKLIVGISLVAMFVAITGCAQEEPVGPALILYEPDAPVAAAVQVAEPTTQIAGPTSQPTVSLDEAEKMIKPALAQAFADMTLGKSTLGELVPALAVEPPEPGADWFTMLLNANRLYPDDKPRRLVYLAQGLKEGDPAVRMEDLGYPIPTGNIGGDGDGNIRHGIVIIPMQNGIKDFGFQFAVNKVSHQMAGPLLFFVNDAPVHGIPYSLLYFDWFNRLTYIMRDIEITGGNRFEIRADNYKGSIHCSVGRVMPDPVFEDLAVPATQPAP